MRGRVSGLERPGEVERTMLSLQLVLVIDCLILWVSWPVLTWLLTLVTTHDSINILIIIIISLQTHNTHKCYKNTIKLLSFCYILFHRFTNLSENILTFFQFSEVKLLQEFTFMFVVRSENGFSFVLLLGGNFSKWCVFNLNRFNTGSVSLWVLF